jgi:PKD repeat protein
LLPLPCVLLVDDDNNAPDVRPYYTAALDALGVDYDVFDVGGGAGNGPTLEGMMGYQMIIWFSGDKWGSSAGPNGTDEANLAAYLDAGGRLFLSSQDYLYDWGLTPFGQTYLGIGSYTNDSGGATSKHGVAGDPIGDGLGPYPLTYPAGFSDYGDIVNAGAGASLAFRSQTNNDLDIDKDGGAWRTVFFGTSWVPIHNASPANGQEVLGRIIDWFGGCGCEAPVITDLSSDSPVELGEPLHLAVEASGTAPLLYVWQMNGPGTGSGLNTATPVMTYTAPGVYTPTVTVTNACGSDEGALAVVVTCDAPAITDLSSDGPVELGTPLHLAVEASGTAPLLYAWQMNGPGYGSGLETATPVMTYTAPGVYTPTVTVTNDCGSDEGELAVGVACDAPEATFVSNSPVTIGEPIAFTALVSGTAPLTYAWEMNGPGTGSGLDTATPVFTYTAYGSFTVVLTVTNPCGLDLFSDVVKVMPRAIYLPILLRGAGG